MSLNTLETAYSNGDVIDASHINEITLSLLGSFVGRNGTGVPTPYQDLGTALIPWGNFYARQLIIDGTILDPSEITSRPNRIISGASRANSAKSDFLRAHGAALSFKILANSEDLFLSINDTPVQIGSDITVTGVTAAPSSNNTCQVNEPTIPSPIFTAETGGKYLGEDGDYITLDSMGSNVTAKIGQIVAFKTSYFDGSTTHVEIMYGLLESGTKLKNVFRGYFFDSDGNPIGRSNFVGNDSILTLMSLGWVFIDVNGVTVDVSYKTPVFAATAPDSPAAGDYWYDQTLEKWKRYSGSAWVQVNRLLLGTIVADATNCIAARSLDFDIKYYDENTIVLEKGTGFIVQSNAGVNRVNVNGADIDFNTNIVKWNLQTILAEVPTPTNPNDLAVGDVFLYIKENGALYATTMKPYDRRTDLKGFYHPYESWRCIGKAYISTDAGATELGIMENPSSFIYNPKVPNPIAELIFSKPVNTAGGGNTAGGDNVEFNELDNRDGAVNYLKNSSGMTNISFQRGEYEIEFTKVAYAVDDHRLLVVDQINGQIAAIGSMVSAPTGVQSEASLRKRITVRAQECVPTIAHQTLTANAGDGYGLAMNALYPEYYGYMKIKKIK